MEHYDPKAIVESYTKHDEISRVVGSSDAAIMFQIERWFIERYLPELGTVIDVGGGPGRFSVEIAKLGQRLPFLSHSDRCNRKDLAQTSLPGLFNDEFRHRSTVIGGISIGHTDQGRKTARYTRLSPCSNGLFVFVPWLSQMNVHIDEARGD